MKPLLISTTLALALGAAAWAPGASAARSAAGTVAYCGKSWVKADADGDGKVTPAEADKALDQEFAAIDTNGDGSISKQEYRDCQNGWLDSASALGAAVGKAGSAGGMASMAGGTGIASYGTLDANHNGVVTPEEYRRGMARAYEQARGAAADKTRSAGDTANMAGGTGIVAYGALDANHDGVVTPKEYRQGMAKAQEQAGNGSTAEAEPVPAPPRYVLLVPQWAGPPSGPQQAVGRSGTPLQPGQEAAFRKALMFAQLDRNRDGEISRREWDAYSGPVLAEALSDQQFQEMDRNGDGKLSKSEYRAALKREIQRAEAAAQASGEAQAAASARQASSAGAAGGSATKGAQPGQVAVPLYVYPYGTM